MVQAYSIGTSKRADLTNPNTKVVPGPGQYEQEKKTLRSSPQWGFGSGKRPALTVKQGTEALGPGQYAIP